MPARAKPSISATAKAKVKQVLAFAQQKARHCKDPAELFVVIFGPRGKVNVTFPTEKERIAFAHAEEQEAIEDLFKTFPVASGSESNGNPTVTLHLPRSVYAALTQEAATEGVSLDRLCLSKLVAQLRKLV